MALSKKTIYLRKILRVRNEERILEYKLGLTTEVDIEQIEDRRPMNLEMDVIYILSPLPHIVDCLVADLERHRYRRSYIIWTSSKDLEVKKDLSCNLS